MQIKRNEIILPIEFLKPDSDIYQGKIPENSCFLGVDGGGTKTIALIGDAPGSRLVAGYSGPSNPESVGLEKAAAAIQQAVSEAMKKAGVRAGQIMSSIFTLAGITRPEDAMAMKKYFQEFKQLHIFNDIIGAWASGTECKAGVAVIAGTGSNNIGVDSRGKTCRAGGWGHILADEGSGYWLGLNGIKAALKYYDGLGKETSLMSRMMDFYKISEMEDMLAVVYKDFSKERIADFAVCVCEEALKKDKISLDLFNQAGEDIGRAIVAIIRYLHMKDDQFPVALIGGVFKSGPLVIEPLEKTVRPAAPGASIIRPEIQPVGGSFMLAVRMAGQWKAFDLVKFKKELKKLFVKT
jgi:glucosamine kinase